MNTDGRICLPRKQSKGVELAALDVEHSDILREVVLFVGKHHALSSAGGYVVVVGGKALQVRLKGRLADPPVEIHEVRMIFIDEFRTAGEPIVKEGLVGWKPALKVIGVGFFGVVVAGQRHGLCRAVKAGGAPFPNIGVELHAAVVPPPMLGAVRRHAEVQAALASGGSKLTNRSEERRVGKECRSRW